MKTIRWISASGALAAFAVAGLLAQQTPNYLAKFDGSGQPVASVVYETNDKVGIGTTSPLTMLHLVGGVARLSPVSTEYFEGGEIQLEGAGQNPKMFVLDTFADRLRLHSSGSEHMTILDSGRIGIGTSSPSTKLHVVGDVTVSGNIAAKYQDVAEWVDARDELVPGTVVTVDPDVSNGVRASQTAYDTAVAGVISAQPGVVLGEPGPGKVLAAQSGRVRVRANDSNGTIRAGDLLVSSGVSGEAMRSAPVAVGDLSLHRPGTILGKALESLREGHGEILVLLTLQ